MVSPTVVYPLFFWHWRVAGL